MGFWLPHWWPFLTHLYWFVFSVMMLLPQIRKLHEYTVIELFQTASFFESSLRAKEHFLHTTTKQFYSQEIRDKKTAKITCLRNWLFAKLSLIFFCSNDENCDECGDYVRHVFSFVPGSLAAISLLVVLLFHASKTICKESGEICYYDTFRVIVIYYYNYLNFFWKKRIIMCRSFDQKVREVTIRVKNKKENFQLLLVRLELQIESSSVKKRSSYDNNKYQWWLYAFRVFY